MRLAYYAGVSTAAAAACLLKAFHERPNFYSATVYLSQSNACLLILTNLCLVLACSFIYGLQRLLYGPLRPVEIEQLSEKAWYAVLDTLLAMPSFREDVGGWLLAMFTLLLAGKVWGWIGEGKVDVLEQQPPANPKLFHARLSTSLVVSVLFDLWMLNYCVETVLADPRPGMMIIFTFEFAVLSVSSSFTLSRYLLSLIQARVEKQQMKKAIDDRKDEIRAERAAARQNETADGQATPASAPNEEPIEVDENEVDVPGWEEKRRYLFALEVFTDFIKLLIYMVFFTVSITFNGLPMHIMRDVYMTFASFSKRVSDYVAYRKATSDMNTRYPDATTEEIRGDACIVCRESMVAWEQPVAQAPAQPAAQQPQAAPEPTRRRDEGLRAKKLPCGHILHLRCLKAWLERQQVCPTCRRPVVVQPQAPGQGQQGAPGANGAAPGQQAGQQPAARQGRARILNFGPVRIGFLNGPGDQINNIVRQMQNQPPAAGQNAAQGPNHLGLQVPYADGQQQANPSTTTATASTQSQLAQIEQRLLQEARILHLERQQLHTLRSLEHELGRLRALQQLPLQQPLADPNQSAPQQQQQQPVHPPTYQPMHPQFYSQLPLPAQEFHGIPTQQFSNGHESLPAGMTVPEGWTVMPLQRASGAALSHTQGIPAQPTTAVNGAPAAAAPAVNAPNIESQQNGSQAAPALGPTDENGSPFFVPSTPAPATNGNAETSQPPETAPPLASSAAPEATTSSTEQQPPVSQPNGAPWASDGWSFVDAPNGHALDGKPTGEEGEASGNGAAVDGEGDSGKGKGKAVEVEEVRDEEF